jgi:hypothetical protein
LHGGAWIYGRVDGKGKFTGDFYWHFCALTKLFKDFTACLWNLCVRLKLKCTEVNVFNNLTMILL